MDSKIPKQIFSLITKKRILILFGTVHWVSFGTTWNVPITPSQPPKWQHLEDNFYLKYSDETRESIKKKWTKTQRAEEFHRRNLDLIEELSKIGMGSDPKLKDKFLNLEKQSLILVQLPAHPIVGYKALQKYDPDNEVGFCFGRASYIHWMLLKEGIDPQNILKLFAMGILRTADKGWHFHVATIVKDFSGQWWALDDLVKKPMQISEWMKQVESLDQDPKNPSVRFYFSDPIKFFPSGETYETKVLSQSLYKGYFMDLIHWMKM